MIQDQFVEHPATGFLSDKRVHGLSPQTVECDGVIDGLSTGLDGERDVRVADRVSLSVDRTQGHAPQIGIEFGQLGNVVGDFACGRGLALPVEVIDVFGEAGEVGDHHLLPQSTGNEDNVLPDDVFEGLVIQLHGFDGSDDLLLACYSSQLFDRLFETRVSRPDSRRGQCIQELVNADQISVWFLEYLKDDVLHRLVLSIAPDADNRMSQCFW